MSNMFGLGIFLAIILQIATGTYLGFKKDIAQPFASMKNLFDQFDIGRSIMSLHNAGASLIFALLYAHMAQKILKGTYRNTNVWIIGVVLWGTLLFTAFAGQLLRMNQRGYWGFIVFKNLLGFSTPVLPGDIPIKFLFWLHALIPIAIFVIVVLHVAYIFKGPLKLSIFAACKRYVLDYKEKWIHMLCILMAVVVLSGIVEQLGDHDADYTKANPIVTPILTPVWYIRPLYAVLAVAPGSMALAAMICTFGVLFSLPFLRKRPITANILFIISASLPAILITTSTNVNLTIIYAAMAYYFGYFLLFFPWRKNHWPTGLTWRRFFAPRNLTK